MKNITVSVDEEIYRRSRFKAAEMETSVSAPVRAYLVDLVEGRVSREQIRTSTPTSVRDMGGYRYPRGRTTRSRQPAARYTARTRCRYGANS